jgi:hypothetical protein
MTYIIDTREAIRDLAAAIDRRLGYPRQHERGEPGVHIGRHVDPATVRTERYAEPIGHPDARVDEAAYPATDYVRSLDGQRLRVSDTSADEVTVSTRDAAELDASWTAEVKDEPIRDGGGTKR